MTGSRMSQEAWLVPELVLTILQYELRTHIQSPPTRGHKDHKQH